MIGNVERFFVAGFSIWRGANVPDPWGGNVFTYASHIAALSGRLRPLSGDMRMSADKDTFFGTHRFYCFPADIRAGDQLREGTKIYEINNANDMMNLGRLMQLDVEEVV